MGYLLFVCSPSVIEGALLGALFFILLFRWRFRFDIHQCQKPPRVNSSAVDFCAVLYSYDLRYFGFGGVGEEGLEVVEDFLL
jgi:hypothetical protein